MHKLNYRELLPTTQENLNKLIRFICTESYRLSDNFKSMECLVWNINYTDGCIHAHTHTHIWRLRRYELLPSNTHSTQYGRLHSYPKSIVRFCGRRRLNKIGQILLTDTFRFDLPYSIGVEEKKQRVNSRQCRLHQRAHPHRIVIAVGFEQITLYTPIPMYSMPNQNCEQSIRLFVAFHHNFEINFDGCAIFRLCVPFFVIYSVSFFFALAAAAAAVIGAVAVCLNECVRSRCGKRSVIGNW